MDSLRHFGVPALEAMSVKQLLALSIEDLVSLGVLQENASQLHSMIINGAKNANDNAYRRKADVFRRSIHNPKISSLVA